MKWLCNLFNVHVKTIPLSDNYKKAITVFLYKGKSNKMTTKLECFSECFSVLHSIKQIYVMSPSLFNVSMNK